MKNKMLKIIFIITGILVSIGVAFFIITSIIIGLHIQKQCNTAKAKYGNNCINGLIATLEDEKNDFRTRNDAIWALGQLGNETAYNTLNSFYTGIIPDREPLDEGISQYELQKALKLTSGGINGTAWVWRWWVE